MIVLQCMLIPFLGTVLGSGCVFLLRGKLNDNVEKALCGFAAGIMVAASIWSLLLPAMDQVTDRGKWSFLPAVIGFWLGTLFLLALDHVVPHLHQHAKEHEGPDSRLARSTMMVLAVTLHNIPEGMAVGVVCAGALSGSMQITVGSAFALALGIAIQNFPEGAIISMPLRAGGANKIKAFGAGVLSGAVEPLGCLVIILAANKLVPLMPYFLSLAAGAMMYVVVEELIPEMNTGKHSNVGVLTFAVGFTLMLALDVALS